MSDKASNFPTQNETQAHTQSPRVAEILDQYVEDLQHGRACSREELLAKHADLKDSLVEYLDGLEMVTGLGIAKELVPRKLDDFEIVAPIGQGAMGTVYRANQLSLKRAVALKVLRYSAASQQASKRFEREAELVATLRHSNIVPIYATGEQDNSHYLAMQLIDGPSLSQWSAEPDADRNPVSIALWGVQIARALAHAHHKNVIHRDVKPSNLLKDGDHIWLTDFGLARRYDDHRMSMTGAVLGTPNYMSPEQAAPSRQPIDFRTDIYSLGATLFELLTGRCVFLAETPHSVLGQVLSEEPPQLSEVLPDASADLETILMKCLEREPRSRYETAEQLADDLEAFANGRSIKARRPSWLERATRWKRQNNKAVSWATTAAVAVLTFLGMATAFWISWNNSITGTIKIDSDEGPIVGRLIDANGEMTPAFTIPTQQSMPIKEGEYTLQMWAGGKLGENQRINVGAKQNTSINTVLSDEGVFPEQTVEGFPAALHGQARDDLVFFSEEGISRIDGRTGEKLWIAKVEALNAAANKLNVEEEKDAKKDPRKLPRNMLRLFSWQNTFNEIYRIYSYSDWRLPKVIESVSDIDDDGVNEVMIAFPTSTMVFLLDGSDGAVIWHHRSLPMLPADHKGLQRRLAVTLQPPLSIGDINDDGITDFAGIFSCDGGRDKFRWIEAISGKTGQQLWQMDLPQEWFDKTKFNAPELGMFSYSTNDTFHRHMRMTTGERKFRKGRAFRGQAKGEIRPWAMIGVSENSGDGSNFEFLVSCGDRLISINPTTGEAGSLNGGEPVELGFFPALQPRLIQSESGANIGLLLCDAVTLTNTNPKVAPVTRFALHSVETGKQLWSRDTACDPGWLGVAPDWPLIADVTGDSDPEILISDDIDLQSSNHRNISSVGSMQALDVKSGKPLWDTNQTAKIRCQDQQIQNVLVGPDLDGDRKQDVYVVTPMLDSKPWIFVDILRGDTGQRIKTVSAEVPVFENALNVGLDLETPFFLGDCGDLGAWLVVASKRVGSGQPKRQSTVVMSVIDGELAKIGSQLEYPMLIDGDGDGHKDLFLIKPRNRSDLRRSAQLVSLKTAGSRGFRLNGGGFIPTDDINGDGVSDLISENSNGGGRRRIVSGADGSTLSQIGFEAVGGKIHMIDGDFDGDGVSDCIVQRVDQGFNFPTAVLTLVSGKEGQSIWSEELDSSNYGLEPRFACEDMDRDGTDDLLVFYRTNSSNNAAKFELTCLDGVSGGKKWSETLAPANVGPAALHFDVRDFDFRIVDVNNDQTPDIVCPVFFGSGNFSTAAIDGRTGKRIWELKLRKLKNVHAIPRWRSELISATPDSEAMFVTACGNHYLAGDMQSVEVDFVGLDDGMPISSWMSQDRLGHFSYSVGEHLPSGGFPFPVHSGNQTFAGICVMNDNGGMDVCVIDGGRAKARLVNRVSIREYAAKSFNASLDQLIVADINEDGTTDAVFQTGTGIVAVDLVTGAELQRQAIEGVQEIRYKPGAKFLELETEQVENSRIKLVDLKSFDVTWDLNRPRDKDFVSILSKENPSEPSGFASAPRTLFRGPSGDVVCTVATAAEFRGDQQLMPATGRHDPILASGNSFDPRLIEPLPWNSVHFLRSPSERIISTLTQEIPIALGVIFFPILFLRRMIQRRQWTLKSLMLLPLLFVVPYLSLGLTHEFSTLTANQYGVSDWIGKVIAAIFGAPTLVFVAVCLVRFWNSQWKRLMYLIAFALVGCVIVAILQHLGSGAKLPDGGSYDLWDPETLMLFSTGAWIVGFFLCCTWVFNRAFGLLLSPFRYFSRRSETVVA
jgi:serine/threonine protein kinase/outer membrane protein assembly factor BamB